MQIFSPKSIVFGLWSVSTGITETIYGHLATNKNASQEVYLPPHNNSAI